MKAPDALSYRKPGPQKGWTLDWQALRHHVEQHADLTQKERARYFGVSRHCIWHALHQMALTRKNHGLPRARPSAKKKIPAPA